MQTHALPPTFLLDPIFPPPLPSLPPLPPQRHGNPCAAHEERPLPKCKTWSVPVSKSELSTVLLLLRSTALLLLFLCSHCCYFSAP